MQFGVIGTLPSAIFYVRHKSKDIILEKGQNKMNNHTQLPNTKLIVKIIFLCFLTDLTFQTCSKFLKHIFTLIKL